MRNNAEEIKAWFNRAAPSLGVRAFKVLNDRNIPEEIAVLSDKQRKVLEQIDEIIRNGNGKIIK